MRTPTKAELLAHCAIREPKRFQYDAHDVGVDGSDDVTRLDDDSFCIMGGNGTYELMAGCAVRVLIDFTTPPERALLGLRKIVDSYERDLKDVNSIDGNQSPKANPDRSPALKAMAKELAGSNDPVLPAAGQMIALRLRETNEPLPF